MSDYTPGFERWWKTFPAMRSNGQTCRKGKGAAFTRWQKDKLESRATELVELLERQIANDEQFRTYTPLPTTYLNQRRYDDFIPKPKRAMPKVKGADNSVSKLQDIVPINSLCRHQIMGPWSYFGRDGITHGCVIAECKPCDRPSMRYTA